MIISVLVLRKSMHIWRKYARNATFLHFRSLTLTKLRLVDLRITPPFSSIRSNIYENYTLSITFQYWVNERWGLWQTDRQISQKQKRHLRWWMYWTMCIMGRWSFWSCFDVTPSTADEDTREKPLLHFVPDDLDLWPLDLKFGTLVTPVQRYVFTRLEVSSAFLFRENMRYGTGGETDWRTDGRTGCNI